ncbi:MAG: fumarate reductase [Betaproteobacteria bacterium RIFCSPLOWO2_02_FULL_65_24]|nr:MAG: fumarate reductase [Betaproteobacteria bacterium RIFCSPLOWO2_02_FULL_65_24]OGA74873.1 MAG: fumarate reductase [Betaproteobacteria bacterium RIFCSPLOWO2_12_FULL_66_14]
MSTRPYVRSTKGWWRENPYYVRYMMRELASVLVGVYGLVLLWGLVRLSQGQAAYEGWLESLKSPWAVGFHVVMVLVFLHHVWSWFDIMPKTLPAIRLGGKRLSDGAITVIGILAALVCCIALWGVAVWLAR